MLEEVENLLDETTRTYDKQGVEVLILDDVADDVGDRFPPDAELTFENPVPLFRGGGDWNKRLTDYIGSANLYRQGKSLLADFFIIYDSPERLALEIGTRIYPGIMGAIIETRGLPDGTRQITKANIRGIQLHMTRNADSRIPSV